LFKIRLRRSVVKENSFAFFIEKAGADYSVDEKTDKKTTGNVQQII
jgi:hypothetical protein